MGTSLVVVAIGQEPSTLADKIKALREEWTTGDDQPVREPRPAPRRAAPIKRTASTQRASDGGLPQIEPNSLMPNNLFSAGSVEFAPSTGPTHAREPRTAARTRHTAAKSPSIASERNAITPITTARRSPTQRPHVDFEADDLREELSGLTPAPAAAATDAESKTAAESPEIVDDFAAGLTQGVTKPSPTKAKATTPVATTSRGPISLPASTQPIISRNAAKSAKPPAHRRERNRPLCSVEL